MANNTEDSQEISFDYPPVVSPQKMFEGRGSGIGSTRGEGFEVQGVG